MKIRSALFIKSSAIHTGGPDDQKPEFAFIGRSNVGKSSLINFLVDVKTLAKTSSTPGKTQLINHFLINDEWYLVDLPGIGYAKTSKSESKTWLPMVGNYLTKRTDLLHTFMLLDARLAPQKIDVDFMNNLVQNQVPFSMVFTKTDKLTRNELQRNISAYRRHLLEIWEYLPEVFLSSASNKIGREELLEFIEALLKDQQDGVLPGLHH